MVHKACLLTVIILYILTIILEMEMRKLHMGTMSYGFDSMDEVAHQLASAFGVDQGAYSYLHCFIQVN